MGRFLKVNKPGVAKKYRFFWLLISLFCSLGISLGCWSYMKWLDEFYYMGDEETLRAFLISLSIFSFILFYLQSILFTSKVMSEAVPLTSFFKSISIRKNNE